MAQQRVHVLTAVRRERHADARQHAHLAVAQHDRRAQRLDDALGDTSDAVLALHGTLFGARCTRCGRRTPHDVSTAETLPRCEGCGALLRPDVVWFGETLDPRVLDAAFDASRSADACLVVGTSALVQPAARVATLAARAGATVVEVNAEETPLSGVAAFALRGRAGEIVPRLLD